MKKLTILGASGHGRVVADIARLNGYDTVEFLDDDETRTACGRYPVVGKCDLGNRVQGDLFIAMGNAAVRKKYTERFQDRPLPVLIHPDAVIAEDTEIGAGTVIMAGAVVNPGAFVGKGCIVNTCSSVDHDCRVGDYVHIAVGAHLCGTVSVGEGTWIGAGSIVSNNVSVCGGCMIGAGAVVVRDITEAGTYLGVPAKKKKT